MKKSSWEIGHLFKTKNPIIVRLKFWITSNLYDTESSQNPLKNLKQTVHKIVLSIFETVK